jgi:hypothetical protein
VTPTPVAADALRARPTAPRPAHGLDVAPGGAGSTPAESGTSGVAEGRRLNAGLGYGKALTEAELFRAHGLTGREREW